MVPWIMNYLGNFYIQLYHLRGKLIHEDNNKEVKSLYDITYNTQQKQQQQQQQQQQQHIMRYKSLPPLYYLG